RTSVLLIPYIRRTLAVHSGYINLLFFGLRNGCINSTSSVLKAYLKPTGDIWGRRCKNLSLSAALFGWSSRPLRLAFETASGQLRLSFGSASAALRLAAEDLPNNCRSPVEQVSNKTRRSSEEIPTTCRAIAEGKSAPPSLT